MNANKKHAFVGGTWNQRFPGFHCTLCGGGGGGHGRDWNENDAHYKHSFLGGNTTAHNNHYNTVIV